MSMIAMHAMYRLKVRPALDGYSSSVLQCLSWRADEREDIAFPSLDTICNQTCLNRPTVIRAIRRLESARLIQKVTGGGRRRSNRYKLRFVQLHRASMTTDDTTLERIKHMPPIPWAHSGWNQRQTPQEKKRVSTEREKGIGVDTVSDGERVSTEREKGIHSAAETVTARIPNNNYISDNQPGSAPRARPLAEVLSNATPDRDSEAPVRKRSGTKR